MRVRDQLRSFRSLWGLAVVVAAFGPLALWVPDLQPPWPEGSHMITTVLCLVMAVLSFSLGRHLNGRSTRGRQNRSRLIFWLGFGALALGLACSVYYLSAFQRYVVFDEQMVGNQTRKIRRVIGTELVRDLRNATETPLQLLRENGYNPETVWTRESLLHTQFIVLATFVGTFVLFTAGLVLLACIPNGRSRKLDQRQTRQRK